MCGDHALPFRAGFCGLPRSPTPLRSCTGESAALRHRGDALMYLKRLELQGFKSFLGKTLFEFGPGITAIVGPNGSGKSNVAESLRWVLGEQTARNLRARRLEDVIFSGSSQRAAVGMAEVSITLDNETGWLDRKSTRLNSS